MIQRWFDARGAVGRSAFLTDTTITWLLGNLGFLALFPATGQGFSFAAYGRLLDHRGESLDAMAQIVGTPWTCVVVILWLAQVWALAALSSKRLHDMGFGGWMAGLSLVPGVQMLFWLALCLWPSRSAASVRTA